MKTFSAILLTSFLISIVAITIALTMLEPIKLGYELKMQIITVIVIAVMVSVFVGYLFFYISSVSEDSCIKNPKSENISDLDFLAYDVIGTWWTSFISSEKLSNLASIYFAHKHKRKLRRYREFKNKIRK